MKRLYYIFDPLCGWCYGAGPLLESLVQRAGEQLQLLPSGLFSGEGARPMDEAFVAYAWSNDQRIERLTGQPFSQRYRSEVLDKPQQMFDSGPATVALTAVHLTAPQREAEALKAIQHARYVDGLDNTAIPVLLELLRGLGLHGAAARLAQPDAALLEANNARMAQARQLMRELDAQGVPSFVLERDGQRQLLNASTAFSKPEAFVAQWLAA
ncbi:DsbA family protein [Comamonas sp. B-9]|uniref:DsbA family protein n=1 Tax=Comamonas sp. B-9 TaxID=1055192 RepID=UPI000395C070|nr:DsbA family protein [Comamonas sp. B-9]